MKTMNKTKLIKLNDQFLSNLKSESSLVFFDKKMAGPFNVISFGFGELNTSFPPFIFLLDFDRCKFHQVKHSDEVVSILEQPIPIPMQRNLNILIFFEKITKHEATEIKKVQKYLFEKKNINTFFIKFRGTFTRPLIKTDFMTSDVWTNDCANG